MTGRSMPDGGEPRCRPHCGQSRLPACAARVSPRSVVFLNNISVKLEMKMDE